MNLTVEDLTNAILAARNLEKLQGEVRDALIAQMIQASPPQTDTTLPGAPSG